MFQQYLDLIKKALEKLPFFNYINRLLAYIKTPKLTDSESCTEQLEHSLLDVFNALGLVIIVSVGFTLYSDDFGYMNAYKIFNPIFLAFTYVTYGVFFALGMAISSWGLSKASLFARGDESTNTLLYTVFCHSLRFYAAMGLFLGALVVHAMGLVITEGVSLDSAFKHWSLMLTIIVSIIWFPFRLYINPLFKYLKPIKFKALCYMLILLAVILVTTLNQRLPLPFTDRMVIKEESCKFFKSGNFYKNAKDCQKPAIAKVFCELWEK
jgi:hypothetical protein